MLGKGGGSREKMGRVKDGNKERVKGGNKGECQRW